MAKDVRNSHFPLDANTIVCARVLGTVVFRLTVSIQSYALCLPSQSNKAQSAEGKDGKGGDGVAGGEDDGDDDGEGRAEGKKRRAQTEEEKQETKEAAVKAQRASAAHARLRCVEGADLLGLMV